MGPTATTLKRKWLGPVQFGGRLGLPASTVHAVLVRCRINRLSCTTGPPVNRQEHDHPGSPSYRPARPHRVAFVHTTGGKPPVTRLTNLPGHHS